jgi:hypothetical protein
MAAAMGTAKAMDRRRGAAYDSGPMIQAISLLDT